MINLLIPLLVGLQVQPGDTSIVSIPDKRTKKHVIFHRLSKRGRMTTINRRLLTTVDVTVTPGEICLTVLTRQGLPKRSDIRREGRGIRKPLTRNESLVSVLSPEFLVSLCNSRHIKIYYLVFFGLSSASNSREHGIHICFEETLC